ncbi:phage tail family protein [Clostridium sp. P21]|uniref:Phage tail family protein n=1 Tax=Clostridium muellerianum TaxID=2716538 RepID=A0A7Y0EL82_9CLOT|nr:phage tail family protein [Clostridium muellerianum]NMM65501.1 phage tail family protein [Clostridium muellerianum]
MARKDFKLIYENGKGQSIEFSIWSSFFLEDFDGLDGLKNNIYTNKGMLQDGETFVSSNLDMRNIVIQGTIHDNVQYNKPRMISALNPKLKGKLTVIDGEVTKYIRCYIEKSPTLSNDNKPKFVLSLICPNPFFYDKEVKTDVALWRGDFEFPLEILETGILLGHREPSLIVNVINESDLKCPLKIEFKALGTLKNPSLFNVNTREYFKINKEMKAGEKIVTTTGIGDKKVIEEYNGIVNNAFNYMDINSTFLQLDTGDNLFRYDAEKNVDNLEVSIYYYPQYLGV